MTHVRVDPSVRVIEPYAFCGRLHLRSVELNEGLELIKDGAFENCASLRHIRIPSTVYYIAEDAFKDCDRLETIEFCEEIEQLVNEASLHWWNHGLSEVSLRTYSFLLEFGIPARLGAIQCQMWRDNIYDMLQRIPEELEEESLAPFQDPIYDLIHNANEYIDYGDSEFFASIDSWLYNYEQLRDDVAPILELALWKLKMDEHSNGDLITEQMKLQCRFDSLSMVTIIIPNTLSFL